MKENRKGNIKLQHTLSITSKLLKQKFNVVGLKKLV